MNKQLISIWMQQIRAPFLVLSVVLVFLGISAAAFDGHFSWLHSLLLLAGVVQTHISVNLFNELSDFNTEIDANSQRTPFSGGSGMMQAGLTNSNAVKWAGYVNMGVAGLIGFYFCIISSWWILGFMLLGGLAIRFYTTHFARWLIGEFIAGLTLGSCVIMGVYLAVSGTLNWHVFFLSLPSGILTTQLLFLNEFPDADVDREGGRKHWVIFLGRRRSAILYTVLMMLCYATILAIPSLTKFPATVWLGLGTLPLAVMACRGALRYHSDFKRLVPAMGQNVLVVLLTNLLLGVGLIFA